MQHDIDWRSEDTTITVSFYKTENQSSGTRPPNIGKRENAPSRSLQTSHPNPLAWKIPKKHATQSWACAEEHGHTVFNMITAHGNNAHNTRASTIVANGARSCAVRTHAGTPAKKNHELLSIAAFCQSILKVHERWTTPRLRLLDDQNHNKSYHRKRANEIAIQIVQRSSRISDVLTFWTTKHWEFSKWSGQSYAVCSFWVVDTNCVFFAFSGFQEG